jgi:hypothetical protein
MRAGPAVDGVPATPSVPADHQAIVDDLEGISATFAALLAPLSPSQFHWQAEPGRSWSVGQCVDHLARTNRLYLPALRAAADAGRSAGRTRRRALRPNLLGRWFIGIIEPPARLRVPVPRTEMVPPSDGDPKAIWEGFLRVQKEVAELVRATADLDVVSIRFRNPLARNLSMFNLGTGFQVIAAHERRHLAQARKVLAAAEFPG